MRLERLIQHYIVPPSAVSPRLSRINHPYLIPIHVVPESYHRYGYTSAQPHGLVTRLVIAVFRNSMLIHWCWCSGLYFTTSTKSEAYRNRYRPFTLLSITFLGAKSYPPKALRPLQTTERFTNAQHVASHHPIRLRQDIYSQLASSSIEVLGKSCTLSAISSSWREYQVNLLDFAATAEPA